MLESVQKSVRKLSQIHLLKKTSPNGTSWFIPRNKSQNTPTSTYRLLAKIE